MVNYNKYIDYLKEKIIESKKEEFLKKVSLLCLSEDFISDSTDLVFLLCENNINVLTYAKFNQNVKIRNIR